MFNPKNIYYMNKLVTGPKAAKVIDINLSPAENISRVAEVKGRPLTISPSSSSTAPGMTN
ncbi:hypothetical protein MASR2M79_12690 [Aminivibrio sp.]